jgi:glycine/D-amino acid oxidase-like deaminating enzyme
MVINGHDGRAEVAIIGAGNIGIAVAYYLVRDHGLRNIVLVDPRDPMSLTSAQSGENYRNWWPDRTMTAFTDDSIDLMEEIARASGNRINMTRRGYLLVTRRSNPSDLIEDLFVSYGEKAESLIRIHGPGNGKSYQPPLSADWQSAPDGVDVLTDPALIRANFPSLEPDAAAILHIRRAGSLSGQQLGQFMLEAIRAGGGRLVRGEVTAITGGSPFRLSVRTADGSVELAAERIVNAAGPFAGDVQAMLGEELPISCVYQQKVSFEDTAGAIPRTLPFAIDLDRQQLDWTEEERQLLRDDPATAKLTLPMTGGIHCRPDGAEDGKRIKLGWAYNERASDPAAPEPQDAHFPDIVLRAASRLHPKLRSYIGRLPRGAHHYGGYYAMTPENLPLIGPSRTEGAYLAVALSGYGTMAACATGKLCAAWMIDGAPFGYTDAFSPARYWDGRVPEVMASAARGLL